MHNGQDNNNDDNSVNAVANPHPRPAQDQNPNPSQVARREMMPFDAQLNNHVLFSGVKFTEVSLTVLKSDDAIRSRLNFKYIDLQILRIITSNQAAANV